MVKEAKNNCTEFAIRLNTFQLKRSIDNGKKKLLVLKYSEKSFRVCWFNEYKVRGISCRNSVFIIKKNCVT